MSKFLSNRVALVTGGSTGIGRAISLALAEAGASVAVGTLLDTSPRVTEVGYRPSSSEMDAVIDAIKQKGTRGFGAHLNVCEIDSVELFKNKAEAELGPIDILVNVAGIYKRENLVGHRMEHWKSTIETNLTGPFLTTRAFLGGMIERRWGRIINIASTAASVGAVGHGAYCASKAGVLGLTRCTALEGGPYGVTCNAISPGQIDTPSTRLSYDGQKVRTLSDEQLRASLTGWSKTNPQNRLVEANEIASLAVYLCTELAFGISAQDLTVSGGALY